MDEGTTSLVCVRMSYLQNEGVWVGRGGGDLPRRMAQSLLESMSRVTCATTQHMHNTRHMHRKTSIIRQHTSTATSIIRQSSCTVEQTATSIHHETTDSEHIPKTT